MKKVISVILAVVMLAAVALLAVPASAQASRLPAEYREIQYVATTGYEVIDTGIKVKGSLVIEVTFQVIETVVNSKGNGAGIVGAYPGGSIKEATIQFAYARAGTNWTTRVGMLLANDPANLPPVDTEKHTVVMDAPLGTVTFDGKEIAKMDPAEIKINEDNASNCNITIGASNMSKSTDQITSFSAGSSKIYSVIIKDGNNTVREFVPAVRIADNYVGMFDLVEKKFYENAAYEDWPFEGDETVTTVAEPVTEIPTTEVPTTEAPKTDAPKTDAPAPATEAPKTDAPVVTAAATDAPAEKKGCGSAVASMAIIAVVSLGALAIRKKH